MKFFFSHSHSLYPKVTIPLALEFLGHGHQVSFKVNRPTFFGKSYGFTDDYIKRNPNGVSISNPKSFGYVSRIINHHEEWQIAQKSIRYIKRNDFNNFDAIISTTKQLPELNAVSKNNNMRGFAIGYQHIPFVVKIATPNEISDTTVSNSSVFLSDNLFSRRHSFPELLGSYQCLPVGFLYLDKVWAHLQGSGYQKSKDGTVLVFHPGGYRGIFSEPGDSKSVCYANQKNNLEQIFLPLLEAGFRPVIKIHPLRAMYHDFDDVAEIISEIEVNRGLHQSAIQILRPDEWYWDYAFKSRFMLTFGSSSIYELWSAGLENVFVCNFFGKERSGKFEFFDNIIIDSYDSYLNFVESGNFSIDESNPLTKEVFKQYSDLFTGESTKTAFDFIVSNM